MHSNWLKNVVKSTSVKIAILSTTAQFWIYYQGIQMWKCNMSYLKI